MTATALDWGGLGFGLLIGWYVYYINRYRKGDVQIGDITTLIGALGGAAVLKLFPEGTDLFGYYGIGLAVGFFGYFLTLVILVGVSDNFDADWFLDGRRKDPGPGYSIPGGPVVQTPMALQQPAGGFHGVNPGTTQQFFIGQGGAAPLAMPMAAALDPTAQKIIDTCKTAWPNKKTACNDFVIEVASQLGVTLSGLADDIVDQIHGAGWTKLDDGLGARHAATQGMFVVAGIKAADFRPPQDHGHVVVVVAGAMNPTGWAPAGYWGSLNSAIAAKGGAGNPISQCFAMVDADTIYYSCRNV